MTVQSLPKNCCKMFYCFLFFDSKPSYPSDKNNYMWTRCRHFTISLETSSVVIPVSNNPGVSIANMRLPNLTALPFFISVLRKTQPISIWTLHSWEWSFLLSFYRPQSFLSKRFLIRLRHPLPVENIRCGAINDLSYTFVNKESKWKPSQIKITQTCVFIMISLLPQL